MKKNSKYINNEWFLVDISNSSIPEKTLEAILFVFNKTIKTKLNIKLVKRPYYFFNLDSKNNIFFDWLYINMKDKIVLKSYTENGHLIKLLKFKNKNDATKFQLKFGDLSIV